MSWRVDGLSMVGGGAGGLVRGCDGGLVGWCARWWGLVNMIVVLVRT